MMRNESKLTKYTLVAIALLLIAYFSTDARADTETDVGTLASICAASHGLIGVYHEKNTTSIDDAEVARVMYEQGQWWTDFLVSWLEDEAAAKASITFVMKNLANGINDDKISYSDLLDIAETCRPLKEELIAMSE